jgi:hypothetical protein
MSLTDSMTARVERKLIMTAEASQLLADLAHETGTTEGDVLRMAIGLFKLAVESKKEGKHLGIAASPEALDIEFTAY